jgi:hypothetical protein
LNDPNEEVWKDALDGIVTIGGGEATAILNHARVTAEKASFLEKISWIDEALGQIRANIYANPAPPLQE